jgi:ABC-type bacteriocin/lantibiotic exporter with double-glycine peptidase domain
MIGLNKQNNLIKNLNLWQILKDFKISIFVLICLYVFNECSIVFSSFLFAKFLRSIEFFYKQENTIMAVLICGIHNLIFWIIWVFIGIIVKVKGGKLFNQIEIYVKKTVFTFILSISYEDLLLISGEKAFNFLKNLEYSIKEIFSICIVDMLANSFAILINIIILFVLLPEFGTLLLIWIIIHFFLLKIFFNNTLSLNKDLITQKNSVSTNIIEVFLNILTIKTTNAAAYEQEQLDILSNNYHKAHNKFLYHMEKFNALTLLICEIVLWGGMTFLIFYKIQRTIIPLSTLMYIVMINYNIVSKIRNISVKICKLFEHLGEYNMIFHFFQSYPVSNYLSINLLQNKKIHKIILELKNINYHGVNNIMILKNINLKIVQGEKICFIGNSGCGKSTLLNIICGLYKNYTGDVLINNINVNNIHVDSIMEYFAITSQHVSLLNRSIKDNLVQNQAVEMSVIERFCKITQIHKFVLSLTNKYNTIINGKKISGGQTQRLCLARALLRTNAPILIFDEVTNGLDYKTKHKFLQLVLQLIHEKKTMIFVDHSLEFLDKMDRIILVQDGCIILNNTYEKIKNHPLFLDFKNKL